MGNEPTRRRRRVRSSGGKPPAAETAASGAADAGAEAGLPTAATPTVFDDPAAFADEADVEASHAERGLRGLVGGGSSQVSPAAALRARDAARPTAEDLARAEQELAIIRRHWTPRD
jgi:hypothetical protein